jgi:hypothetical protein
VRYEAAVVWCAAKLILVDGTKCDVKYTLPPLRLCHSMLAVRAAVVCYIVQSMGSSTNPRSAKVFPLIPKAAPRAGRLSARESSDYGTH